MEQELDQTPQVQSSQLIGRAFDPRFYLESFCKIKGKEAKGLIPFILTPAQLDLFNTLRKNTRVIALKARQIGFSTAIAGYLYHKTVMSQGVNTALVAHKADVAAEFLDKVKTFWRTTPEEIRPKIHFNSKWELSFPGIDSKIMVLTGENVGRGMTLHNVLASELALWDKPEEMMLALENAVPLSGQMIVESTPNGVGNLFHRMWMNKDNGYEKRAYGWWWHYTEEEINKIRKRMDPRKFAQEYGLEFLASGRNVFDLEVINEIGAKFIARVGDAYTDEHGVTKFVREQDGLRIYREPTPDHNYVAGVDVAEGVSGGDYSVVSIWDRTTGEEVAFWRGHMAPDKFAEQLNKWGRLYNKALMVVEVNNHGLTTLTVLKQLMYPQLYFRPAKFDVISTQWSERLGWKTTKVTRPLLIDDLNQGIRDGALFPRSEEFYEETITFVYDDGNNMVPQRGYHDDCIFAAAIANQGFKVLYKGSLEQVNYNDHLPFSGGY